MAGARDRKRRRVLDEEFLDAFERRGRVVAPVVRGVASHRCDPRSKREGGTSRESSENDALLAVQARERGWVVVTRDRDFQEVCAPLVSGLRLAPPFAGAAVNLRHVQSLLTAEYAMTIGQEFLKEVEAELEGEPAADRTRAE